MKIGEVSQLTNLSVRMLRYYDTIGLVPPSQRDSNGYRNYSEADLTRLSQVELLRSVGLSIDQVSRVLDGGGNLARLLEEVQVETTERIAADKRLIDILRQVSTRDTVDAASLAHTFTMIEALADERSLHRVAAAFSAPSQAAASLFLKEHDSNTAGVLLWSIDDSEDSLQVVAEALTSSNEAIRERAAIALAKFYSPRADQWLSFASADTSSRVRQLAVFELGRRGAITAIPALIEHIGLGCHDVEAAEILGSFSEDAGQLALMLIVDRIHSEETTPEQRLRYTQALAELAGAGPILQHLVQDADPTVSATAQSILRTQGTQLY